MTATKTVPAVVGGVLLVILVLLLLPGDAASTARPDANGVVEVVMQDYAFEHEQVVLPTGEPLTVVFANRDEVSHSMSIGRVVVEEDDRAVGFTEDLLEGLPLTVTPAAALTEAVPPYHGTAVMVPGGPHRDARGHDPGRTRGHLGAGLLHGPRLPLPGRPRDDRDRRVILATRRVRRRPRSLPRRPAIGQCRAATASVPTRGGRCGAPRGRPGSR